MSVTPKGPVNQSDILIVGAGVIGLFCARACAMAGAKVTLVDRARPGQGASMAAAGMLTPGAENRECDPVMMAFGQRALSAWKNLANEDAFPTSIVDLHFRGVLDLSKNQDGLRERALKAQNAAPLLWTQNDLTAFEPELAYEGAALSFPGEGQVDPIKLVAFLEKEVAALGVTLRPETDIISIDLADHPTAKTRTGETFHADHIVLAAAVLPDALWGEGKISPFLPVKGQAISVESDMALLRRIIRLDNFYIAPKAENRLIIGATEEPGRTDLLVKEETVDQLMQKAIALVPGLSEARLLKSWAGHRPAVPDRLPVLGRSRQNSKLIYATGHYRNGILFAPYTADLVSQLILGATGPDWLSAFSPQRFDV